MAARYLGEEFDIHGGGLDLRFPHHENELAQSRAAGMPFARMWMHNAWVTTSGEKMSKSLGNSLLVTEVAKRVRPVELRYYLVSAHYRSHQEFSFEALDEAANAYRRMEAFLERAAQTAGVPDIGRPSAAFVEAMNDDLGVPAALAALHDVMREGNAARDAGDVLGLRAAAGSVRSMLGVLGLDPYDEPWLSRAGGEGDRLREVADGLVAALLDQRQQARESKDFAAADAIRDTLTRLGVQVADSPDGPQWSFPASAG